MSRSIERMELLVAPDFADSAACCVCGTPATNRHHVVPKGMGGTSLPDGPTVPVCGMGNASGCHRLAHGLGLTFRHSDTHGWAFFATDEASADINKRRRSSGLPRIRAGLHPCVVSEEDTAARDESVGVALADIQQSIEEASRMESTLAYAQGVLLREARAIFDRMHVSRREQQQAFAEWVTDTLGFDKATVSKRTLYAGLPESAATLGATKGYLAAKAVKDGLASTQDAIDQARELSVSDLRAMFWPRAESPSCRVVCPLDGSDCSKRRTNE